MKKNIKYFFGNALIAIMLIVSTITGCKKDDDSQVPVIPNEEEIITTLKYLLTPASGGEKVTLEFRDLDGDGGNDPVISTDTLAANTTYVGTLQLLNEAGTPLVNISAEVKEEGVEHQFFFTAFTGLEVLYTDSDEEGNPIGLETSLKTADPGSGTLTITLRHEPNKTAEGVSEGKILNAGGETDIEVTFEVTVK